MARGFRRRGHGKNLRYAARLDPLERAVIAGLMEQVVELLDPRSSRRRALQSFFRQPFSIQIHDGRGGEVFGTM